MNERTWNPEVFLRRIKALEARGLDHHFAVELWESGDGSLVTEVERASDADIAALNAARAARTRPDAP